MPAPIRPDDARQPRRIVEPDRQDAEDQDRGDDQADALLGPELEAGAGPAADEQLQDLAQCPGEHPGDCDERDRQQQLVQVVRRRADQRDAENPRAFDMGGSAVLGRLSGIQEV